MAHPRRPSKVAQSPLMDSGFLSLMCHGLILNQAPILKSGLWKVFCSPARFRFVPLCSIDHIPSRTEHSSLPAFGSSNVVGPLVYTLLITSRTLELARRRAATGPHRTSLTWLLGESEGKRLEIVRGGFQNV